MLTNIVHTVCRPLLATNIITSSGDIEEHLPCEASQMLKASLKTTLLRLRGFVTQRSNAVQLKLDDIY